MFTKKRSLHKRTDYTKRNYKQKNTVNMNFQELIQLSEEKKQLFFHIRFNLLIFIFISLTTVLQCFMTIYKKIKSVNFTLFFVFDTFFSF